MCQRHLNFIAFTCHHGWPQKHSACKKQRRRRAPSALEDACAVQVLQNCYLWGGNPSASGRQIIPWHAKVKWRFRNMQSKTDAATTQLSHLGIPKAGKAFCQATRFLTEKFVAWQNRTLPQMQCKQGACGQNCYLWGANLLCQAGSVFLEMKILACANAAAPHRILPESSSHLVVHRVRLCKKTWKKRAALSLLRPAPWLWRPLSKNSFPQPVLWQMQSWQHTWNVFQEYEGCPVLAQIVWAIGYKEPSFNLDALQMKVTDLQVRASADGAHGGGNFAVKIWLYCLLEWKKQKTKAYIYT